MILKKESLTAECPLQPFTLSQCKDIFLSFSLVFSWQKYLKDPLSFHLGSSQQLWSTHGCLGPAAPVQKQVGVVVAGGFYHAKMSFAIYCFYFIFKLFHKVMKLAVVSERLLASSS